MNAVSEDLELSYFLHYSQSVTILENPFWLSSIINESTNNIIIDKKYVKTKDKLITPNIESNNSTSAERIVDDKIDSLEKNSVIQNANLNMREALLSLKGTITWEGDLYEMRKSRV